MHKLCYYNDLFKMTKLYYVYISLYIYSTARKEGMIFSRFSNEKLPHMLVNRTVIFLFLICLLTLFLYTAGTVQTFMDSTQLFLLGLYEVLGLLLLLGSAWGITFDLYRFYKDRKRRYLIRAGGYLLLVIFSIVTVLMVMAISAFSSGSRAV